MTILNRWFEEVLNQGRESAIDEMMWDDAPGRGLVTADGRDIRQKESFKAFHRQFRSALRTFTLKSRTSSPKGI
jgi:hypothetical protein